jgi:phosphoglycolate phosphatase-like HAD superfamily hydrolase/ADP-ribose pyrophosphatase YjhB (NUDIX family)
MFRNLIFDWSGTLVDDLGPVIEATNTVFERYNLPPFDRDNFRRQFRLPYSEFYAEFLPDIPLAELETHFRPAFNAAKTPVTILPHAREKLEWCTQHGIRAFVLTSMDTQAFERQMDDFELRHHFEATYSGIIDKRDMIHRIIEQHWLKPHETAFVGDMTHDVETARHGGLSSIAVLTGYQHPEVLAAVRPDLMVPDLEVLRKLMHRQVAARPIATVGALIHDGAGRVLMMRTHKWSGLWGIPGGKIKRGEPSLDALTREVLEETNLQISDIEFVLNQDCIASPEFMHTEHFILLNYIARATGTDVRLNDEAEEFLWLTPTEAIKLPLNSPTRVLLDEALNRKLIPHAHA